MGSSYRASIGHPEKNVNVETARFSIVGKDITLTLTTGTPSESADWTIPAGGGMVTFTGTATTHSGVIGPSRAVQPGDIIEIAAGAHGKIEFIDVEGAVGNRIKIRGPQTGSAQAVISGGGQVLKFTSCRYIDVDGQCDSSTIAKAGVAPYNLRRGIKVNGTAGVTHNIKFSGRNNATYQNTRDITLRYIEISGGGTAGSDSGIAINDTGNDQMSPDNANNWQENILIEYCYLHDIGNEGMYLGGNIYIPKTTGSPKPVRYIKVRHNILQDIGWEGIQSKKWVRGYPGMGTGGTSGIDSGGDTSDHINAIHHNILLNVGSSSTHANDNSGISSLHSESAIYNNWIEDVNENGIVCNNESLRGTGTAPTANNTHDIFNNVVIRSGQNAAAGNWAAIKISGATAALAGVVQEAHIYNNTTFSNEDGISCYGNAAAGSFIKNNITVDNAGTDISAGAASQSNNTTGASGTMFIDKVGSYGATNFGLTAQKAATGSVNVDIAPFDYDDATRNAFFTVGAFEF